MCEGRNLMMTWNRVQWIWVCKLFLGRLGLVLKRLTNDAWRLDFCNCIEFLPNKQIGVKIIHSQSHNWRRYYTNTTVFNTWMRADEYRVSFFTYLLYYFFNYFTFLSYLEIVMLIRLYISYIAFQRRFFPD